MGFNPALIAAGHSVPRADIKPVKTRNHPHDPSYYADSVLGFYYTLNPDGSFDTVDTAPKAEGELWCSKQDSSTVRCFVAINTGSELEWIPTAIIAKTIDSYTGDRLGG